MSVDNSLRIGFMGLMGAGKSAAANYVGREYGAKRLSFAAPIKAIGNIRETYPSRDWAAHVNKWAIKLFPHHPHRIWSALTQEWVRDLHESSTDRELWQRVGDRARGYDPNVWVRNLVRQVEGDVVVDDIRRRNELDDLLSLGFTVVHVTLGEDERRNRILRRDRACDWSRTKHSSETELDGFYRLAHYTYKNEGKLSDLYDFCDRLVASLRPEREGCVA